MQCADAAGVPVRGSACEYLSDGHFDSGADSYLRAEGAGYLSVADAYGALGYE